MVQSLRHLPLYFTLGFNIAVIPAFTQEQPRKLPTLSQSMQINFGNVNKKIMAMAQDFPESKYDYRPGPDVRSFAEVILHVAASNNYVAKTANGEKLEWAELSRDKYKTKADIVEALKQSIATSTDVLKAFTDERLAKSPAPWPSYIEHAGEHYGQLVVYYRVNGLVPPGSRPKDKTD